jgi:alpha-L-fucosidase
MFSGHAAIPHVAGCWQDAGTMMQPWFPESKLGILVTWGIYSANPTGESWPLFLGEISREDYYAQARRFTAERYDPDAWAGLFARAGARYAVLVAKHHDGFALWDTAQARLNARDASPAGRDLVGPFAAALRGHGLRVGIYFSHSDWSHPDYPVIPYVHGTVGKTSPFVFCGREDRAAWERFLVFHRAQLEELCTRYRPDLLWFDGDWERKAVDWRMAELREQLHGWLPEVVLNSRLAGHGDYSTPEQGIPTVPPGGPWEFCMTLNDHWGYYDTDRNYKTVHQLVWHLVRCASRGGNLLLSVGPRADGTLPGEQVELLEGLGAWLRPRSEAVHGTLAGLPEGCCEHATTLSIDRKTVYVFVQGVPTGLVPLVGLRTAVRKVRVVGGASAALELEHRRMGGAWWFNMPGVLWIDLPVAKCDPVCTVLAIELQGALDLCVGQGHVITAGG